MGYVYHTFMPRPLDKVRIAKARELYQQGIPLKDIAPQVDRILVTVALWCKDLIPPSPERHGQNFMDTDSELRSYFLGLFMADGWLQDAAFIESKDYDAIAAIATSIHYTKPIMAVRGHKYGSREPSDTYTHRIMVTGRPYQHLVNLGFPKIKSGKEFIPSDVTPETFRHFLRGVSDGDGTMIQVMQYGKPRLEWSLVCANPQFLNDILIRLRQEGVIGEGISVRPHRMIYRIHTGHKDAIAIGAYMYKDATLYMGRKFQPFDQLREVALAHRRWTAEEAQMALEGQIPVGRTRSAFHMVLRKLAARPKSHQSPTCPCTSDSPLDAPTG